MNLPWHLTLKLPQTRFLLVGVGLGYIGFLFCLGFRAIAWVMGGAIALFTLAAWVWQLRHLTPPAKSHNLLQPDVFLEHVTGLEQQLSASSQSTWAQASQWAIAAQQSAARIAQREPLLIPDLLETLHTVLDLTEQVVAALQATEQVQTADLRVLVQQRLQASCDRLQQTCHQLQSLQDQLALSALDRRSADTSKDLPVTLQLLVAENKTILQHSSTSHP